jgi:hypothetical protein
MSNVLSCYGLQYALKFPRRIVPSGVWEYTLQPQMSSPVLRRRRARQAVLCAQVLHWALKRVRTPVPCGRGSLRPAAWFAGSPCSS